MGGCLCAYAISHHNLRLSLGAKSVDSLARFPTSPRRVTVNKYSRHFLALEKARAHLVGVSSTLNEKRTALRFWRLSFTSGMQQLKRFLTPPREPLKNKLRAVAHCFTVIITFAPQLTLKKP
jgi:hypothetical protein